MDKVKKFAHDRQLGAVMYLRSGADCRVWGLPITCAPTWVLAQDGKITAIGELNIKNKLGINE